MRIFALLFAVAGVFAAAPSLACGGSKPSQVTASSELPTPMEEAPPQLSRISRDRPAEPISSEPGRAKGDGSAPGASAPGTSR